jgi:hypothetical protein
VRRAALAAAAALTLAGCPLPQPVPDYPAGTTITPPRILVDRIVVGGFAANTLPVILVPAGCPTEPVYPLGALVSDTTNRAFDARWFVSYDAEWNYEPELVDTVLPDPNPLVLTRTVPPPDPETGAERPFVYRAYYHLPPRGAPQPTSGPPYGEPGLLRVVELVVSNGFDADTVAPRNRAPRTAFETQVYRWTFLTVAPSTGACDPAADPACVKCP